MGDTLYLVILGVITLLAVMATAIYFMNRQADQYLHENSDSRFSSDPTIF